MIDEKKLKDVLAEILEVDPSEIHEDSSMDTIESWESIRHMNLILAIEEEFGVAIPDDEAANLTSYALLRVVLNELTESK
jgi:acyl carrier protein